MELFKNFNMGGLFQAGRKMAPPWGAFRRYTNAYQDPSGTIMPYGRGEPVLNVPTVPASNGAFGYTHLGPLSSQFYRKGIVQLHALWDGAKYLASFSYLGGGETALPIMQPFSIDNGKNIVDIRKHMQYLPSGNLSTCTVARKSYVNSCINTTEFDDTKDINGFTPVENWLIGFDGIRTRGAGLPTPWTFVDNSGVAAAHYVRAVYATIGMDAELILSPYMQCRLSGNVKDLYKSGYSAYPGTKRTDVAGTTDVIPTYRSETDHLFEAKYSSNGAFQAAGTNTRYFDKRFLYSTAGAITVTTGEISMTLCSYSPSLEVGDWIMGNFGQWPGVNADLWMFKVKTLASTTVFESGFKYLDRDTLTWVDANFADVWPLMTLGVDVFFKVFVIAEGFSNLFMIVSYSTTPTSGYVVSTITPIFWDVAHAGTSTNFATPLTFKRPWAGVVSSLMADWYDQTVVKTTFPPLKGITNYKELLVGYDSNALYFSDVSLGGSTEMVGGLSNLVPYGTEFGDIIAVCGSEDFLLISRERKNYVLTGDIAGSSFNITESDQAVPGAYNTKCATNAWSGQVIFANSSGVFSVTSSGVIKDIGEEIKGLFFYENKDQNLFDKSVFKTIQETRDVGYDGASFKFLLEDKRGFVVFITSSLRNDSLLTIDQANMLVFNTKTGKWYEFEGYVSITAEAINGKIIALGNYRYKEDGIMRDQEKQLLVSQWMTVDQPSIDKQICQLKMFGEFTETDAGVRGMTVGQQNNWADFDTADRDSWNTNVQYLPEAHELYFHKKRMDASKPLATSVIIESLETGSFTVEGMEIEGVVVQTGMKK